MKCQKCGESLHPEQKVCIACGTQTDLWPGGATKDNTKEKELPWKKIGIIGGGVLAIIILVSVLLGLRVTPPDQVTQKWVDAVVSRQTNKAKQYTTEAFEASSGNFSGVDQTTTERKSDDYYQFVYDYNAQYKVSAPQYDSPSNPTAATVTVTFTGKDNMSRTETIGLVRQKDGWKINGFQ